MVMNIQVIKAVFLDHVGNWSFVGSLYNLIKVHDCLLVSVKNSSVMF
jgi:hypothetical protein